MHSFYNDSLYFVGKGVTYDTVGIDIKRSGHMRGKFYMRYGSISQI